MIQPVTRFMRIIDFIVIINSYDIAYKISGYENIKPMISEGLSRRKSPSLIGDSAVENLKMYQADKYIVSTDGISNEGFFNSNVERRADSLDYHF